MKLKRPLHGSETGADVRMVQRALNKWVRPGVTIPVTGAYDWRTKDRVIGFQLEHDMRPSTGKFGQKTLDALWPYFDAYGRFKYRRFKPLAEQDVVFEKLVASMQAMTANTPGYLLGGGHGIPIKDIRYDQKLDCSSSTSKALYDAGLFSSSVAWVSGQLESWGEPGPGRYFTVYANADHVWIRLRKTRWWRFDTSPHGDGGRGPQLRYLPRFTSGFVPRHWPGL